MSDHDDFGAFLIGFIVGGVTGAISALLFAPQSGEETRVLIRDKAIELKDQTSETVTDTIEKAESSAKEAITKAEKFLEEAKKKANELVEKGQVILDESKEKVANAVPQTKKATTKKNES
jgi:gas vesicle protein